MPDNGKDIPEFTSLPDKKLTWEQSRDHWVTVEFSNIQFDEEHLRSIATTATTSTETKFLVTYYAFITDSPDVFNFCLKCLKVDPVSMWYELYCKYLPCLVSCV